MTAKPLRGQRDARAAGPALPSADWRVPTASPVRAHPGNPRSSPFSVPPRCSPCLRGGSAGRGSLGSARLAVTPPVRPPGSESPGRGQAVGQVGVGLRGGEVGREAEKVVEDEEGGLPPRSPRRHGERGSHAWECELARGMHRQGWSLLHTLRETVPDLPRAAALAQELGEAPLNHPQANRWSPPC